MAYRLKTGRPVAEDVRRIALSEIDRAIARCDDPRAPEERVHDLRKHCKKLRGLIRLVHGEMKPSGAFATENAALRDAADGLGGVRDRQAMITTFDALFHDVPYGAQPDDFVPIRQALVRKLCAATDSTDEAARLTTFRARMAAARLRVPGWPIGADGFAAVGPGLIRSYRRGRKAMKAAKSDPTPASFHEWRKRAKYHWYHARLIAPVAPVAPEALQKRCERAKRLGKLLGTHHDLAVLRADLAGGSPTALSDPSTAALVVLIDARMAALGTDALALGSKLYRRKSKRFAARMAALWPDGDR